MAIIIAGESGTGKTSQCMTLPQDKVAMLTLEEGLLCFKKHNYMPRIVATIRTSEDLAQAFIELSKGIDGIEYVFIDSLTEMANMVLDELKTDPKYQDPKMTLKMYMTYGDKMTKLIKAFRDMTKYSVIFTCLTEIEKDGTETYDDFNIPGSSVKAMLKSYFDITLHLKAIENEDGTEKRILLTSASHSRIAKDRSGALESVENANLGGIIRKILL
jgi:hypothetical protein